MTLRFNINLYSKEALFRASYHFTDEYYIKLDVQGDEYTVSIISKGEASEKDIEGRFENELLSQVTREIIADKTKNIREMLLGRALASTIIDDKDTAVPDDAGSNDDEGMFEDWFNDK